MAPTTPSDGWLAKVGGVARVDESEYTATMRRAYSAPSLNVKQSWLEIGATEGFRAWKASLKPPTNDAVQARRPSPPRDAGRGASGC